ncbi:MAG: hypothetical protein R3C58_12590 [Parvularculaceae bacterium]
MTRQFHLWLAQLRVLLVALFAVSQLAPAGYAFAADDNGFSLVICTKDGAQSVSWEDFTGEPSPFPSDSHDDGAPCHACVTGACHGGGLRAGDVFLPSVVLQTSAQGAGDYVEPVVAAFSGPPSPSRAPPSFLI